MTRTPGVSSGAFPRQPLAQPVIDQRLAVDVLPDADAVAARVAELLLHERQQRPQRPLGLATGRTMEPVYAALATRWAALSGAERQRLTKGWQSFNLDEYVGLGRHDPGSFAAEMEGRLVEPLGLNWTRVGLPNGLAPDPVAEAHRYGASVQAAGGIGLQLLGLGLNGHVGFNEPPCEAHQPCHALRLCSDTRAANAGAFGGVISAVPERAITLGMAEILAAERIVLVVTGPTKARVLQRLLNEPPNRELPASWLQRHPSTLVIVDEAAWNGG